jgi:hypothetical protein
MKINDLIGNMCIKHTGGEQHSEDMCMYFADGTVLRMYHRSDCCESVAIEEIIGDMDDLLGAVLLEAEEVSEAGDKSDLESSTWTFYKFGTHKGRVTLRWLGSSNGYYSESVEKEFTRMEIHEFANFVKEMEDAERTRV